MVRFVAIWFLQKKGAGQMVYGDRLREPHASRGVLRAATPGPLNEKGRVAD
jgi:hypothetical protein